MNIPIAKLNVYKTDAIINWILNDILEFTANVLAIKNVK